MSIKDKVTYFLGLQVRQLEDGIFIIQYKYTKELIKKFFPEKTKSLRILMSTSAQLTLDGEAESLNLTTYWGTIGPLLYLIDNRPDISYVVGVCAKFKSNPKKSHYEAALRIVKYLKGNESLRVWYPIDGNLDVVGYFDSSLEDF